MFPGGTRHGRTHIASASVAKVSLRGRRGRKGLCKLDEVHKEDAVPRQGR